MQKRHYEKEGGKRKTYQGIAIALSVAAILFLIINSIYLEVNKQRFVSELKLNPSISLQTIHTIPILVDLVVVIWIALALILIFSLFFLRGTRCLWVILLIISKQCSVPEAYLNHHSGRSKISLYILYQLFPGQRRKKPSHHKFYLG